MSKKWQKCFTRPTRTQDFEVTIILPVLKRYSNLVKEITYIPHKGKWECWFVKKEFKAFVELLGKSVLRKNWTLKKHLNEFNITSKKLIKAARKLGKTSSLENYQELCRAYQNFTEFIWQPWAIVQYLEDWFVKELKKKHKNWLEIYEALAYSSKAITMQKMVEAVWRGENINKIEQQYGFLGVYSVNDSWWTKQDILKQVGSLKNRQKKIQQAQHLRRQNKIKAKRFISKLDKRLAKVAEIIHEYTWLRTERVDVYKKGMALSQPFYRRLEKEFKWPFGWAAHLSKQEVITALKTKKVPSKEEMKKRDQYQYVARITKDKTIIMADPQEQKKFLNKLLGPRNKEKVKQLKGQTACRGRVKGKARVILQAKNCSQMKKGEILVANMTHPDYLIAIRKAAAIITDEGGIVCHAAIISREFNIPCVIGTKEATKILKTGDQVEVDAEKGIIKIYAKNS